MSVCSKYPLCFKIHGFTQLAHWRSLSVLMPPCVWPRQWCVMDDPNALMGQMSLTAIKVQAAFWVTGHARTGSASPYISAVMGWTIVEMAQMKRVVVSCSVIGFIFLYFTHAGECIMLEHVCWTSGPCGDLNVRCPNGTCLPLRERCDGVAQCSDGRDEPVTCGMTGFCVL